MSLRFVGITKIWQIPKGYLEAVSVEEQTMQLPKENDKQRLAIH
jgi:hypothetical protein